LISWRIFELI